MLWIELIAFFIGIPAALSIHPSRIAAALALTLFCIYALWVLRHDEKFSWRKLWHGTGWKKPQIKKAAMRFVLATAGVFLFTILLDPERLFSFPMQHPRLWAIVMVLYPILSALPQEVMYRSFFFQRYEKLFPDKSWLITANALLFGFMHVMCHNWVAPLLSIIAGGLWGYSYSQHRSLKWSAIEHGLYGCMVFTIGIGFYFLMGPLNR